MGAVTGPLKSGMELLRELDSAPPPLNGHSAIQKIRYSHDAMIDLIIAEPSISQGKIAATFGYTQGWVSQIFSSDTFQARLAQRKDELTDPTLRATLKERFEALTRQSLDILQAKLAKPNINEVSDTLALRAAELGARSLGLGREVPQAPSSGGDRLLILAGRLVQLQDDVRKGVIDGKATRVSESAEDADEAR